MNWDMVTKDKVDDITRDIDNHIGYLFFKGDAKAVDAAKNLKQAWLDNDVEKAEELLTDPNGPSLVQAYFNIKLGFKVS